MKIALIAAPYETGYLHVGESLGIKYLASALISDGHEVDIFEMSLMNISQDDLIEHIKNEVYMLIGFSVLFTGNIENTFEVAKSVRENSKNAHITVGGPGISFIWDDILKKDFFNSCVCFEGEKTIVELANCLSKRSNYLNNIQGMYLKNNYNTSFTGYRSPILDLDSLPFPKRDINSFINGDPHFYMISSRGCSGKCTFCFSGNHVNKYHNLPKWRPRSAKNVIEEIDHLVKDFKAKAITFVDDDFLGGSSEGLNRADEFVKLLLRCPYSIKWSIECRVDEVEKDLFKKMKDSGLECVYIGIDSGNREDLKLFNKGIDLQQSEKAIEILRKTGLYINFGFIMFHPMSNLKKIKENINFLKRNRISSYISLISSISLYCNSPLVELYLRKGVLFRNKFFYNFRYIDPIVELYHQMILQILYPFHEIEIELEEFLFKVQTEISTIKMSKRDKKNMLEKIYSMEEDIIKSELYFAEEILKQVENKHEKNNYSDLKEKVIEDFNIEVLRKIENLSFSLNKIKILISNKNI